MKEEDIPWRGGARRGCWARHHPGRWRRNREACWALHRFGRRAASVGVRYVTSCCLGQRYRQARGSQQRGLYVSWCHGDVRRIKTYTLGRQRGRRGHRNRFAERSFPSSTIGGYDRQGLNVSGSNGRIVEEGTYIEVRPWMIEKKTWSRLQTFHLYLQQRQTLYISLVGLGFKRGKVVEVFVDEIECDEEKVKVEVVVGIYVSWIYLLRYCNL